MKPDKEHLLHELLDGDRTARRDATLLAGAHVLHQRRQRRMVLRVVALAVVLLAAGIWVDSLNSHKPANRVQARASVVTPGPQALTDDQLLALFPNTPVGLATLAHGKKQLIFPRPADERKYVIHL